MTLKSGFKTSEFYMTLIPTVVSMLVISGVLPSDDQQQVLELVKDAIAGIVAVTGIVTYIMGRTEVKKTLIREADSKNTEVSAEMLG